jgi:hypothetical protein
MQVTGLENDDEGRKVMDVTWGTLMQLYLQNLSLRTDSRQRIMNSHWALIFDPFSQLWQLLLKQVGRFRYPDVNLAILSHLNFYPPTVWTC